MGHFENKSMGFFFFFLIFWSNHLEHFDSRRHNMVETDCIYHQYLEFPFLFFFSILQPSQLLMTLWPQCSGGGSGGGEGEGGLPRLIQWSLTADCFLLFYQIGSSCTLPITAHRLFKAARSEHMKYMFCSFPRQNQIFLKQQHAFKVEITILCNNKNKNIYDRTG